uniref:hypothetical protein n=1 Tax=uncultured Draconibacterium sp. TaxID=1573823 RepID=UPI0032169473
MVLTGTPTCATVTNLTCTGNIDELHPQAGLSYNYDVTVPANSTVHWFVIANDNGVMPSLGNIQANIGTNVDDAGDGTGSFILTSTNYNTTSNTTQTSVTWKAFDGLTQQVLLVAYVVDVDGCTDNIELYRILPVPAFTLDVNAIAQAGTEVGAAQSNTAEDCVSPIESATYTPSGDPLNTPGELVADYGENWVYFTVTAANFTHSWQPTFNITYTGTQGEVLEAAWAYPADALANTDWNTISSFDGTTPATEVLHSGTVIGTSVGADDGTGECIVVRVRVDHGTEPENAVTDQTVRLAVNGFMYDQSGANYTNALYEDLHYADTNSDTYCNDTDGFTNDWVEYRLTPRPQIINATAAPSFFEDKDDNSDNQGNN